LAERKHVSGAIAASATPDAAESPRRARPKAAARPESLELSDVYRAHHRFVWRSVVRLGVPDERVADAVHDVFVVVARRLHEYEGRAALRTWLFAIALRVAQGIRRDRAREFRRRERLEREPRPPSNPHARADAARTLRDLLAQLDEDKRAVFIMAELEGMTAPEISAVVGCKVNTVYSRLRLARTELQRMIGARPRKRGGDR
jgi:RNA polymerase sigma-70 factor (ECF subfamily)